MPAYLINGYSGTGKTSIGRELASRGFRVIDTDKELGMYANTATEMPIEFPKEGHPDEKWYKVNGWLWDRKKTQKAIDDSKNGVVFFCGGSLNEQHFYSQFAKIFRLYITPEAMLERLKAREGDPHTNNPIFIKQQLSYLKGSKAYAQSVGWPVIDTSNKTPKESVDEILSYIDGS